MRLTLAFLIFLTVATSARAQPVRTADAATPYSRGVEAEHAGRHDQAIADFTKAIAAKPDFAEAYESRAVAEDQKGHYDRAIADYTRAIALGLTTAETYFNRGAAYEHHRFYQKALADYRAAAALDPALQSAKDRVRRLSAGR